MIIESWLLALDRIRVNPLRSSLTILGVIIGVAAVVALVSIGSGVRQSIDDQFSSLGVDTLTVQPGAPGSGGSDGFLRPVVGRRGNVGPTQTAAGVAGTLTSTDLATIEATSGVGLVAPVVQSSVTVTAGGGRADTSLIATTSALGDIEAWSLAAGSFLPETADDGDLAVAVLGADLADELDLEAAAAIGAVVSIDGHSYGVVGVLKEVGMSFVGADDSVIVPLAAAEGQLIDRSPVYNQIRVLAETDPSEASDAITANLREVRGLPGNDDDFRVVEATSIIDTAAEVSTTLTTMVSIIGGVSLVVGAIGIANMMLVAVRERWREIGIRRAVGATRADITRQFLVEAMVLSVLGGVIGIVLGSVLATGLSVRLLGLTATVSRWSVVGALLVSVVVGVVAGIGPAWQAATVDPTVALRYE